jgi:hypothetical protein
MSRSHEAAAQIVASINSSPRSPGVEEIEAILKRTMSSPASAFADHHHARLDKIAEWIRKTEAADAKSRETRNDADIEEADRITAEFGGYCEAIYRVTPETLTGLHERAAIARYWHQIVGEEWNQPDDCDDWGNRTIAELIEAVLEFGRPPPSKGVTKASEIDFEPVVGSDGKPVDFGYTNAEFANAYCPWIRMAFLTITRDKDGVCEIVRNLAQDPNDPEAEALFNMLSAWENIEAKFEAIASFASAAWARVCTAMETLEETDPGISDRLGSAVDRYIAKMPSSLTEARS